MVFFKIYAISDAQIRDGRISILEVGEFYALEVGYGYFQDILANIGRGIVGFAPPRRHMRYTHRAP